MLTAEALDRRGEREEREEMRRRGRVWASSRTVWNGTQREKGQDVESLARGLSGGERTDVVTSCF